MTDPGGPIGSRLELVERLLPASYQGTLFRSGGTPCSISHADRNERDDYARGLDLLKTLNEQHLARHDQDGELMGRGSSRHELAFRMQTTAAEAVDLARETAHTLAMYGVDEHADGRTSVASASSPGGSWSGGAVRAALLRRRTHRGHLGRPPRLHHATTPLHAGEIDQPIAALMQRPQADGLLGRNAPRVGGEFGRTPTSEGVDKPGRDHNWHGFTMWLAGGRQ